MYTQLRLGILLLYIETGRYDNTPVANRICKLCDSHAIEGPPIEDEFHTHNLEKFYTTNHQI